MTEFQTKLTALLNECCAENGSDTPDYILADYLVSCLKAFDRATNARSKWHGYIPLHEGRILDPQPTKGE